MKKILVIEDEIKLRETLTELLLLAGYQVIEAINGLDGLEKVQQTSPDLIVCDVMMPICDGYDFIKQLKQTQHFDIPLIFLTANTELLNYQIGMDLGAKAYLNKPFVFKELKNTIEKYLLRA